MLDICFSYSECGTLRKALNTKNIIPFVASLELGKIAPQSFNKNRAETMNKYYIDCSKEDSQILTEGLNEKVKIILDKAKNGEELRFWVCSAPYSKCGFYYLISKLQGVACKIFVVEMPATIGIEDENKDNCWSFATSEEMEACLKITKELTMQDRDSITLKWQKLEKENAELRLNVNRELTSVDINYLDNEILSNAPKEELSVIQLMAKTISNSKHRVYDSFIASRIYSLIEQGKFEIVKENLDKTKQYREIIRKKKA